MIKAVFLDVDGTIVDTEPRNRRAIEDVARIGGYHIHPDEWEVLAGKGDTVIWEQLVSTKPDLRAVFNTAASFERGCLNAKLLRISDIRKIEETSQAIALFKENSLDMAAVSNAIGPDAMASLEQSGYKEDDFVFTLFRDDLRAAGLQAKPYPDPYLEALRRQNERLRARAESRNESFTEIKPSECLVLEDSHTGARSGLSAGMHVIQMTDEMPALDDEESRNMVGAYHAAYKPLRRSELVDYCKSLMTPR
jgi:beta-phosphoglucomutase-like phosphatase (HAD superfamily)